MIVDCSNILTCGARVPNWINGEYTKRSGTCNGRPTYQRTGTSEGTVYLYYWVGIIGGESISSWDIGSPVCGDLLYATVFDNAPTPDLITGNWWEYNYNTGDMDTNHDMSTQCKFRNRLSTFLRHIYLYIIYLHLCKKVTESNFISFSVIVVTVQNI